METYNGHRSWNAWNVALWIGNDEDVYRFAMECIERARNITAQRTSVQLLAARASRFFMDDFLGCKTQDGGVYNHLAVKLCLEGFIED